MRQWTATQAETIFEWLNHADATQEQVARALKTSQPAVAKSLQAARWKEVEKGITYLSEKLKQQYAL
jgi:DNA transposition AAA+ family ATPase